MIIKNRTKNSTVAAQCVVASTFFSRLKGLLGTAPLKPGEGLLLVNEKSIHTFFMAFPIDVMYINGKSEVIKLDHNMPPFRLGKYVSNSVYILELPVGTIAQTRTTVGDRLEFSNT